jgi:cyclopropane fatty-acyl-phospholipid synthase-like methyltransferase
MGTDFYEDPANVESYSQFTPAHDGALLIDVLRGELPAGASVLEIGMGPGKDLDLLAKHYTVTGSDLSHAFLDRYRAHHPDADLLYLDARTLDTDRRYDAIFSNKALIHLSAAELEQSFARQHAVLNPGGLILHSLWHGEGTKHFGELTLTYHNAADLTAMLEPAFEILALEQHAKMADGDSIYVLARKR